MPYHGRAREALPCPQHADEHSLTLVGCHENAQALRHSLFEGIQDGHIEVREISFIPSGHGEAMNASRGGQAAPGVDGETWRHYGEQLEVNLSRSDTLGEDAMMVIVGTVMKSIAAIASR
jgi:hypothetical protein